MLKQSWTKINTTTEQRRRLHSSVSLSLLLCLVFSLLKFLHPPSVFLPPYFFLSPLLCLISLFSNPTHLLSVPPLLIFILFLPSLCFPSLPPSFFLMKKGVLKERERESEGEVEGEEGWVSIRAAASSLHVARKTTLRLGEGNIRWQTSTCTRGTSHDLAVTQVRRPCKDGGRRLDLWPLIQDYYMFLSYWPLFHSVLLVTSKIAPFGVVTEPMSGWNSNLRTEERWNCFTKSGDAKQSHLQDTQVILAL